MLEKKPLIYMPRKKRKNVVSGETPDKKLGLRFYSNFSRYQSCLTEMNGATRQNKFAITIKEFNPQFLRTSLPTTSPYRGPQKLLNKVGYNIQNKEDTTIHIAYVFKDAGETPSECFQKCRWVDLETSTLPTTLRGLQVQTSDGRSIFYPYRDPDTIYYYPFTTQNYTSQIAYNFMGFHKYRNSDHAIKTDRYKLTDSDLEQGYGWNVCRFGSDMIQCNYSGSIQMLGTAILDTYFDSANLNFTQYEGVFMIIDTWRGVYGSAPGIRMFNENGIFIDWDKFTDDEILQIMTAEAINNPIYYTETGSGNVYYKRQPPARPSGSGTSGAWSASTIERIDVLPLP